MAITRYNIKKWTKMVFGKSILHVDQPEGAFYSVSEISGYYNDLRNKVKKDDVKAGCLPSGCQSGQETTFSTQIFQYGLGSFDCFLETKNSEYLKSFWAAVKWAVDHEQTNGSWITFPERKNPYGSMAQGEGVSLLCRAFTISKDRKYLPYIEKAYKFLVDKTSKKIGKDLVVYEEFCDCPVVLNGMIFSLFGLFDYYLLTKTNDAKRKWEEGCSSLCVILPLFDSGKWSFYSEDKKYVSPFYMSLHIAQMKAMFKLTGNPLFLYYANKWGKELKNPIRRFIYFWKKALQKIKE